MSNNFQQVHSFHASVLKVFNVWNEVQLPVENQSEEFAFLDDRDGNSIYFQFRVSMQDALLAEVHANGFCFRKLKSVLISPFLYIIQTELEQSLNRIHIL
jgi:hypothetical protein